MNVRKGSLQILNLLPFCMGSGLPEELFVDAIATLVSCEKTDPNGGITSLTFARLCFGNGTCGGVHQAMHINL